MFKEVVPLSTQQHAALRLLPAQPFDFAAADILIPITLGEAERIAREMPIVFPRQSGLPQALLGLEAGKNLHVQSNGQWLGRYVPAHIRRYPFILAEAPATPEEAEGSNRRFVLHFDQTAKHLGTQTGERLFDDAGAPTETLLRVQKILTAIQQDAHLTQAIVARLDALQLLHEADLPITGADGQTKTLKGVRVVDRARLAQLAPEVLGQLQAQGALALIYAHLLSLTNLQDGWIARHRASPQPAARSPNASPSKTTAQSSGQDGALNFDGIDWSKLS